MNDELHVLRYFDEELSPSAREAIARSISATEAEDLEVMKLIWSEAEELRNYGAFSTSDGWSEMAQKLGDPTSTPVLKAVNGDAFKTPTVRRLPLRLVYAAVAVLLILLLGGRFLFDMQSDSGVKSFASYDLARIHAYNAMLDIAGEVMAMAEDPEFEQYVVDMAGDRFDGETNALVNHVLGDKVDSRQWRRYLGEFRNIDGENYYPQIFVHDHASYGLKTGSPSAIFYITDDPTPQGTYEYDAYKYVDGELQFYRRISEEMALQERVWVFSLNENVNSGGELPMLNEVLSTQGTPKVLVQEGVTNGRLDKIGIYEHKESWAGGASEVYVRSYLNTWNGLNPNGELVDLLAGRTHREVRGVKVRSFTRDEISSCSIVEVDFDLQNRWQVGQFESDAVAMTFVIYEHDIWPNGINTGTYTMANGEQRFVSYGSAQEHFDIARVFGVRSPEGWQSEEYPTGIPDADLIENYIQASHPGIYYNTEKY